MNVGIKSFSVSIALATSEGGIYIQTGMNCFSGQPLLSSKTVVADDCTTYRTIEMRAKFLVAVTIPVKIYRSAERFSFVKDFLKVMSLLQGDSITLSDLILKKHRKSSSALA